MRLPWIAGVLVPCFILSGCDGSPLSLPDAASFQDAARPDSGREPDNPRLDASVRPDAFLGDAALAGDALISRYDAAADAAPTPADGGHEIDAGRSADAGPLSGDAGRPSLDAGTSTDMMCGSLTCSETHSCCPDSLPNVCGITLFGGSNELFGVVESCLAVEPPGRTDPSCPEHRYVRTWLIDLEPFPDVEVPVTFGFVGCCQASGECGYEFSEERTDSGGLGEVSLPAGCHAPETFIEPGPAVGRSCIP